MDLNSINYKFKMMPSIFFLILAVTAVQGGTLQKPKTKPKPNPEPKATDNNWRNFVHRSRARADDVLPTFEKVADCDGDLCIKFTYAKEGETVEDVLVLKKQEGSNYIYTGAMQGNGDIEGTVIDNNDGKHTIKINIGSFIKCNDFMVNLDNGEVKCSRGGQHINGDEDRILLDPTVDRSDTNTGLLIDLTDYFNDTGIPVKVLYTFDEAFYDAFDGENDKTGDEYISEVLALTKQAFADTTLKAYLGRKINIVGSSKKYDSTFSQDADLTDTAFSTLANAEEEGSYDLFTFITHPGAAGVAYSSMVCEYGNSNRISFNKAYGSTQCNNYNPPETLDCTVAERITLTAETIAHELGHALGMDHDFDQTTYDSSGTYTYRKYGIDGAGSDSCSSDSTDSDCDDCRGLLDYVDDGVGWSKCSSRDFSRYLTDGGERTPNCLTQAHEEGLEKCNNKNTYTYCLEANNWACTDEDESSWFEPDCRKLCGSC